MTTSNSKTCQTLSVLRPFAALVAMLWTLPALSASVTIAWDPNPQSDVAGYLAYSRVAGSSTTEAVDVGTNTTYTFENLVAGISYVFHVTAYNGSRIESEPAGSIEYTPTASSSQTTDTNAPVLACPPNSVVTIPAGQSESAVTYAVTATDDVSVPTVTCTPASGSTFAAGTYTVICTATDEAGNTSTNSFTLEVNRQPQARETALGTMANLARTVTSATILRNATDEDGDVLTLTEVGATSANGGQVTISGGSVTYTPARDFVGNDSFTYTVTDSHGGIATGTVAMTVWDKNDPTMNRISSVSAAPQGATVSFTGIPGLVYTIERSADLNTSTWTAIGTVTAPEQGFAQFTDAAPLAGSAFYRTVTQ